MKRTLLAASVALFAGSAVADGHEQPNIIYVIGDGMGFEFISAYRYAMSDLETKDMAETQFDEYLTGAAMTYPEDDTWVTDSAASATALATGEKSYNGAIGMDNDKTSLKTVMEYAKDSGYMTGSVSTSQINHATPASFFAHHPSRYEYNKIADLMGQQILDGDSAFDVILGGGQQYFVREDKNWPELIEQQGMQVIMDMQQLEHVQQAPVMGLFAPKGLPHAIDEGKDSLARMTSTALRLLDNEDKPFALMIEGSQIDWCGHANDIACAVHEMDSLNKTLQVVDEYIENNPNTLFVMTADHSTGGLTLGRDGEYAWYSDRVMDIEHSIAYMRKKLLAMDADLWPRYVADAVNYELNADYIERLASAAQLEGEGREDALHQALAYITGDITGTGWTGSGHTAVDVPVYATGPNSEQFRGYMDNTDLGKRLIEIV
ncbi:MAG: alkaline phosphatase, partial [Pseudomonadota bacterium]